MSDQPSRQQLAAEYQASTDYLADAVQWFADLDAVDLAARYIAVEIARLYNRSTAYATVIDDAVDEAEARRRSRLNHPSNRSAS